MTETNWQSRVTLEAGSASDGWWVSVDGIDIGYAIGTEDAMKRAKAWIDEFDPLKVQGVTIKHES